MKFATIFTPKNFARACGAVGICVGVPLLAAPTLVACVLFTGSAKSNAPTSLVLRSNGLALIANGIKALQFSAHPDALQPNVMEYMGWTIFHLLARFSGAWDDMGGRPCVSDALIASSVATFVTGASICQANEKKTKDM